MIPEDLKQLKEQFGIHAVIQPSSLRIYPDDAFTQAGATVAEDLSGAGTVFAVKEIPLQLLEKNKTYVYFSHTIKGQPYNMDMLRRLMALKCNLIDYERIVDEKNQRLIFFGTHAGYAGMVETLFAYARKMEMKQVSSALAQIKQAFAYDDLEDAKTRIREIGRTISEQGLPPALCPLIVGFTGYGNVSRGAQEIFDLLPVKTISPDQIHQIRQQAEPDTHLVYKVVFKEQDLVAPVSGQFDLQEYYDCPEKYRSVMEQYLPDLDILVNCIYWTENYPRLVTKPFLQERHAAGSPFCLSVIGDISCDIEGSIEITRAATMPDHACFTYFPGTDSFEDGIRENGITVMAIDNLPCEFPREASMFFSNVLKTFANDIVGADFSRSFQDLALPSPIKKALILHNGALTKDYTYMENFI